MCEVCCADAALRATQEGSAARFFWDVQAEASSLTNNPLAPPCPAPEPAEGLVSLWLQAEGENEAPGRVRASLNGEAWGPWLAVEDVATAVASFCVDAAWPHVPEAFRATILAGDVDLLYALREARIEQRQRHRQAHDAFFALAKVRSAQHYRQRLLTTLERLVASEDAEDATPLDWRLSALLGALRSEKWQRRKPRQAVRTSAVGGGTSIS